MMPRGPQGQKRPGDTISCAVTVMKIATGEVEETLHTPSGKVRSGQAGSAARAKKLTAAQRSAIARKAALARWHKAAISQ